VRELLGRREPNRTERKEKQEKEGKKGEKMKKISKSKYFHREK
jgi:hypothetical protein